MSKTQSSDAGQTLRDYLLRADERAVFRALPRQIAEALGRDLWPTLELLVEGTFGGETVLHWEIACPNCRFHAEESDWLSHARHDYTCPACGETYDVHLDDEARVTFSPHPTLRALGPEADDPAFREAMRNKFLPTTVHELMMVQAFRDWARDEVLPAGEYLEVRRMTVWFSDLTGSTALYARNGDPLAYDLVREHFDFVFEVINRHQGVVVKTMGDGIMAVFDTNGRAIQAALAAHRALDAFNRQRGLPDERCLMLKIGVHVGPAIVVTLDQRLDYFGTTVNIAARVSDLAAGTETVFTAPVQADPQVREITALHTVEPMARDIRGLGRALTVYRLVSSSGESPRGIPSSSR